jgi:hypothetical protein
MTDTGSKFNACHVFCFGQVAVGSLDKFDPKKAVGMEHVTVITRYMCKLCKQFLPTEPELQEHLRSRPHWDKCVEAASPTKATKAATTAEVVSTTADDEDEEDEEDEDGEDMEDNESDNDVEMVEGEIGGKRRKAALNAAEAKKKK